jgi:hypothetical protein
MEKKEQKEQKKKQPFIAPEVTIVAMETCGIIASSDKTAASTVVEDYDEENVTPTTTDGNSFNVW